MEDVKRILLVEDDPVLLKLYTDLLTSEQLTAETSNDGLHAFEKIKQGGWDLVLLDMMLPQLSGLEIVNKLKTEPPVIPNKKIVFMTNLDKGKEIDEIKLLGYESVIKSSLTPDQFVSKVKSLL